MRLPFRRAAGPLLLGLIVTGVVAAIVAQEPPAGSPVPAAAGPASPTAAPPDVTDPTSVGQVLAQSPDLEPEVEDRERGILLLNGGGRIYSRDRMVALNGVVLLQRGPIELFACTEGGKDHESVLRIRCHPEALNLALILLRLKNGPPPARLADPSVVQGDRVIVTVEWRDADGGMRMRRAEDLIHRADRNENMPTIGWVYVGSQFLPELDLQTGQPIPDRTVFAATRYRSIITTWRDSTTILDNPMPEADDDSLFVANPEVLPPSGTKVRVVLRPPTDDERREITEVERKLVATAPKAPERPK